MPSLSELIHSVGRDVANEVINRQIIYPLTSSMNDIGKPLLEFNFGFISFEDVMNKSEELKSLDVVGDVVPIIKYLSGNRNGLLLEFVDSVYVFQCGFCLIKINNCRNELIFLRNNINANRWCVIL